MDAIFILASLAVLGGAVWFLTRKKKGTSGIVGGPPASGGGKNDGTIDPPRNGEDQF